jgi:hypothetical protein
MVLYDKTMRDIEMHLIKNSHDERLAKLAGLDVYEEETCAECRQLVGVDSEGAKQDFKPYVILLDQDSEWIVCASCASPVLGPKD